MEIMLFMAIGIILWQGFIMFVLIMTNSQKTALKVSFCLVYCMMLFIDFIIKKIEKIILKMEV